MVDVDALDFAGWDLFFWLVLSGILAHGLLARWLCTTCWGSFASWGKTTTKIPSPRRSRVKAGEEWVGGKYQVNLRYRPSSRDTQGGQVLASLIRRA